MAQGVTVGAGRGGEANSPPPPEELDAPGDPDSTARTICLRMLDRRAYTRAELAGALRKRSVPDDAATRVLDRFVEVGLVNDAAFAESFALARHTNRGLAGRAIASQLRRRGVDELVVGAAVAQIDPTSEYDAARALVAARLKRLQGLDGLTKLRRLTAMLARRGYSPGVATAAVRAELAVRDEQLDENAEVMIDELGG